MDTPIVVKAFCFPIKGTSYGFPDRFEIGVAIEKDGTTQQLYSSQCEQPKLQDRLLTVNSQVVTIACALEAVGHTHVDFVTYD